MNPARPAQPKPKANTKPPFEREAARVLEELHPALADVVNHLRPPVDRASDLRKLLQLDYSLSWSLFNAARVQDVRAIVPLLPGRRAMERFLAAAANHGVSRQMIDRAQAAFERFEETVLRHAVSRDAFGTMVAEINGGPQTDADAMTMAAADARQKRSMFRAASLLWGRQARLSFASLIFHPSANGGGGLLDVAAVKGMVGLHQTRRGVPLHIEVRHGHTPTPGDPTAPPPPAPLEAIDPREPAPEAVGLLRDFCSQPPPTFQFKIGAAPHLAGFTAYELLASGLGASSQMSYFTGHVIRQGTVMPGTVPESELTLLKGIDIPTAVYVGDLLTHESVWGERGGEQPPEVKIYNWSLHGSPLDFQDSDLLPLTEKAVYLGRGLGAGRTPLLPRYVEMMSYVLGRLGWNPDEFRIFRCRVEYPLVQSRIRMTL